MEKKKVIIPISIILIVLTAALAIFLLQKEPIEKVSFSAEEITIGMRDTELHNHPEHEKMFFYMYHRFFTDKNGKNVVVEIDPGTWCVTKVHTFPFRRATESNMKKVQEGMTIPELVALIGIPAGSESSGMDTLAYDTTTGEHYWVYLADDMEFINPDQMRYSVYVQSVKKMN